MAGLLIASFLCYAIGFIGPFAFFCNFWNFVLTLILIGGVCILLTFTMNLLIDFVPTYSEKTNNDSNVNPISESDQKQLLANDEGS